MMRRFLKIAISALMLIGAVACSQDNINSGEDFGKEGYITLRLNSNQLATKATEAGEDTYNENLITSVDCFFYPTGKTNENAVMSALGRPVKETSTKGVYEVQIRYSNSQAAALFGSTSSGSCQIYVIANRNGTFGTNTSEDSLKAQTSIETDFTASTTGIQDSFIMDGDSTVALVNGAVTGFVYLERAAAKVQLFANVAATSTVTNPDGTKTVWISDPSKMTISLKNAVKKGVVNGPYTAAAADYVSYAARTVLGTTTTATWSRAQGDTTLTFYSHVPFYSYPTRWYDIDPDESVFDVALPWHKQGQEAEEISYYQVSANRVTKSFKRNVFYKLFAQITTLGADNSKEPDILKYNTYIVLDWGKVDVGEGSQYVNGEFLKYNYLVVNPTVVEMKNQTTTNILYSSSSAVTVTIDKVERYNYSSASGKVLETLTSASELSGYKATVDVDNAKIVYTHSQDNIHVKETIYLTVTNNDGFSENVVIYQYPEIYLDEETGGNVFVNGYFGDVANATFGYQKTNGNYRCNTYSGDGQYTDGNGYKAYYGYSSTYQNVFSGYSTLITSLSSASGGINNAFVTDIHVTSFNSTNYTYTVDGVTNEYKIGDPRVKAASVYSSWSMNPYLKGETSNGTKRVTAAWSNPGNILISSKDTKDQNIVSPQFIIASGMNSTYPTTFDAMTHRAASYQEAGYPAGRWRLPTEAEIAFIMARQNEGVIPILFATTTSGRYWSASGRYYDAHNNKFVSAGSTTTAYCRFVYDTWYWGSKPYSTTNVYLPNGHEVAYKN